MIFSNLYADAYNLLDESYRNLTIVSEETSCFGRYSPVSPVVPPIDPLQSSPIYAPSLPVENLVATEIESVSDDETSALTVNVISLRIGLQQQKRSRHSNRWFCDV